MNTQKFWKTLVLNRNVSTSAKCFYGVLLIHLNKLPWKFQKTKILQALEQTEKKVMILDGFEEISPYCSPKFEKLTRALGDKTTSHI